jgi:hypothetical protein
MPDPYKMPSRIEEIVDCGMDSQKSPPTFCCLVPIPVHLAGGAQASISSCISRLVNADVNTVAMAALIADMKQPDVYSGWRYWYREEPILRLAFRQLRCEKFEIFSAPTLLKLE